MKKITVQACHFEISQETQERIAGIMNEFFSGDAPPNRIEVLLDGAYAQNTAITYTVTLRAMFGGPAVFVVERGGHLLETVQTAASQLRGKLTEQSPHSASPFPRRSHS